MQLIQGHCAMSGKRKTTIDKLIGEQIRSLRKREGFNKLTDFKNEVKDLSYSMLQMIERGDRGCSPENLEKIAEALGVSVAEILEPWEIHRIRGRSEVEDSQRDPKILSGNGLRALAMGDINIDWTSYLSESEANMSSPKKEYRYVYSDAERELGGVGALFALKARSAGFENVSLIGAIGGRSDMPGGVRLPWSICDPRVAERQHRYPTYCCVFRSDRLCNSDQN